MVQRMHCDWNSRQYASAAHSCCVVCKHAAVSWSCSRYLLAQTTNTVIACRQANNLRANIKILNLNPNRQISLPSLGEKTLLRRHWKRARLE